MDDKLIKQAHRKWSEISRSSDKQTQVLLLELEIYKKLLDISSVGNYYCFMFSPLTKEILFLNDDIEKILGYKKEEMDIDKILSVIHPDDLPVFVDFESKVVDFKKNLPVDKLMKYKTRYQYRMKRADGKYLNILQQSISVQVDENGGVRTNLIMHTDITDLGVSNEMKLSFIGLDGEPSFVNFYTPKMMRISENPFSRREMEILKCIVAGNTSETIANILSRSIHTVHVHRKNILKKANCKTVNELIVKSIKEGWV